MGTQWPELPKGKRISGDERVELSAKAKEMYDSGSSIRAIADASDRSIGFVRSLLIDADVTFRSRGGATRGKAS